MADNTLIEQAQKICRNLLDLDLPETTEKIRDAVAKVSSILPLSEEEKERLLARLRELTGITQGEPKILDNGIYEPWILNKWAEHSDHRRFWKRYRDYLSDEKKIAPKIISQMDTLTDNILDRLADPDTNEQFDKRGLVVGHVQSGKTANYVGLITKAADAGYKLIVVLAGIHNSLRSQTQLRIDEGFLGYDTVTSRSFDQTTNRMGVGRFDPNVAAHSLTSSASNGDFRKNIAEKINLSLRGSDPVVIVIKKNNSVLKNLIQWLSANVGEEYENGQRIINGIPLLLIDDEADNASINISKSSVSSINGSIRALLQLFRKSAYVGYTATPYANVFIPTPELDEELAKGLKIKVGNQDYQIGEDLFPRNFIINISPPSNYVGPERFFGIVSEDDMYELEEDFSEDPISLFEPVYDYQPADYFDSKIVVDGLRNDNTHFIPDKHKKEDAKPESLPESLKRAIQYFILSCAARRVRGQVDVHNSMLVHVTRFIDWQNHIALLVDEEIVTYKRRIEFQQSDFMDSLKSIWKTDFEVKTALIAANPTIKDSEIAIIAWDDVKIQLLPAVTKIRIRAVHGSSLLGGLEPENIEPLDYYENRKKGLSVIAIGGNKLSRGLTLEGLTISYYLRSSKMYDTLMQMGRWFGYRPGYLDLCRLFTSDELISHYKHITAATEEMRAEFDRMWLLKKTPREYGLKVRAHTGVLTITAANKFRYKKMMSFSFSGDLKETWQFNKAGSEIFRNNHKITEIFIGGLGSPTGPLNSSPNLTGQQFVWRSEDNYRQIINYLSGYKSSQPSFHPGLISQYISHQAEAGKLTDWTVALITNTKIPEVHRINFYGNQNVGMSFRKDDAEQPSKYYELPKAHIIGNFHEYIDLSDEELQKAFDLTVIDRKEAGKDPAETVHPNPLRIRQNRPQSSGLLLIYPLNPAPFSNAEPYSDVPIIGLALSFPYIENEVKVLYAVNDVFEKELYDYPDELDNEDLISEEEDESPVSSLLRNSLTKETFLDLIEEDKSRITYLDEEEFFSGIVPNYPDINESESELAFKKNLIVSATDKMVKAGAVPYYTDKDILRYYLNETSSQVVLQPDNEAVIHGECVVGMKRSKYVVFGYHNADAAFSDSCWIIKSARYNSSYLVSLFNSTLFGAWVRINGEQKNGTYFIKNEVLYRFPIILPVHENNWIYKNICELLTTAGKKEQSTGSGTMKSYFSSILDALVFTCYFPRSMENISVTLFNELKQVIPEQLPEGERLLRLTEDVFSKIYHKKHPVRELLFFFGNNNKVNRIKSVFKQ